MDWSGDFRIVSTELVVPVLTATPETVRFPLDYGKLASIYHQLRVTSISRHVETRWASNAASIAAIAPTCPMNGDVVQTAG